MFRAISQVLSSLGRALGQLGERAILAVIVKSVAITLLFFAGLGVVLYFALVWAFAQGGLGDGGLAGAALAVLVAGIAAWFLFRVVALAVLQFFADAIVEAVEGRHYPSSAVDAQSLPFSEELRHALRGLGRTLAFNALALPFAALLIATGVGAAAIFIAVNAWLLGRELTDMAWLRHCGDDPAGNPVPGKERAALGLAMALIMLVPGVNLLAPVIGAAAGTHLTHRAMEKRRDEAQGNGNQGNEIEGDSGE